MRVSKDIARFTFGDRGLILYESRTVLKVTLISNVHKV